MIYLASPFTDPSLSVRAIRYHAALKATAMMMRQGLIVYSPIVHGESVAIVHEMPKDHDFWMRHCYGMLAKADTLTVLMLDGWTESRGVRAELDWWTEANRPLPLFKLLEEI